MVLRCIGSSHELEAKFDVTLLLQTPCQGARGTVRGPQLHQICVFSGPVTLGIDAPIQWRPSRFEKVVRKLGIHESVASVVGDEG